MNIELNKYKIIQKEVEQQVEYGYNRAHKHSDTPDKDFIIDQIVYAVMLGLSEIINFEDKEK